MLLPKWDLHWPCSLEGWQAAQQASSAAAQVWELQGQGDRGRAAQTGQ